MKTIFGAKTARSMSDVAVEAKTGKTWPAWFKALDAAGCKKMNHREIVAVLDKHGVGPWWRQMVAVEYERSRGLRVKHETARGFSVSGSRTLAVDMPRLFRAWMDDDVRSRWLPEKRITIRRSTANRSIRMTWSDKKTNVEVMFYKKGERKNQVTVQHDKLPDAKTAARMKAFWAKRLDALREMLETR
jgi:uncharacterized protein YndB with AHSA1/START domain